MRIFAVDSGYLDDFETETDVEEISDMNYKSDIDSQAAGTAPCNADLYIIR